MEVKFVKKFNLHITPSNLGTIDIQKSLSTYKVMEYDFVKKNLA